MSFLNTTQKLQCTTPLPPGTSRSAAIAVLHNHDTMMRIGPHLADCKEIPTDAAYPDAKAYRVTDVMDMLPKGIWSSNVVSTYYHTDREDGVIMVIKAPLDVCMDTTRVIKEEGEGLVLVEDVEIRCSRLLMGITKGQCEGNRDEIHMKYIEKVKELEAEGRAG